MNSGIHAPLVRRGSAAQWGVGGPLRSLGSLANRRPLQPSLEPHSGRGAADRDAEPRLQCGCLYGVPQRDAAEWHACDSSDGAATPRLRQAAPSHVRGACTVPRNCPLLPVPGGTRRPGFRSLDACAGRAIRPSKKSEHPNSLAGGHAAVCALSPQGGKLPLRHERRHARWLRLA